MRRREFIAGLGSAAVWPLAAQAQQPERIRRIGVLMNLAADDPETLRRIAAFVQGLQELGWTDGRNVRIEYRYGMGDADRYRRYSAELVALAPDVILAAGGTVVGALQQATRAVPIVFVLVSDPVTRGLVANLPRPGGNATGFLLAEFALSGKWLELLRQLAPGVKRAAVIRDPAQFSGVGQMAAIQAVALSSGVELTPVDPHDRDEVERVIAAFARSPNGGLIVTSSSRAELFRELIITLAAKHRLPAVYGERLFVEGGGLISYGPNQVDQFRQAAGYVDRILKGEKPANLPVMQPTKFELVINLKTAKALGLSIPETLLATADEVIQ
jgi:putative ABC transport system substrate-binding protein